ncbi:MAG: Mpo1-like protein, partial [Burkholderiaceae bacterium]
HWVALQVESDWVFWGLGLFTIGWVIQFIGHYYEGRKPAFVDDLIGLLVGPMFVCAEVLFALRLCRPTREAIEAEAGPVRLRDIHASALR